jgi:hypothetical protein
MKINSHLRIYIPIAFLFGCVFLSFPLFHNTLWIQATIGCGSEKLLLLSESFSSDPVCARAGSFMYRHPVIDRSKEPYLNQNVTDPGHWLCLGISSTRYCMYVR